MFLDFASNPVLLVAIPLLFAFVAVFLKKTDKALLYAAVVLNVAAAVYLAATYGGMRIIEIGGFAPPFGISLVLDEYSLIGVALLNGIFTAMLLMSSKLVQKHATIFLVSLAALNGMILTGDLFNLFVFMEIAAIAAYIFTAMDKGYKHSFNYLVLGTLGSVLFLFGVILLYNIFGSLNMFDIQEKLGEPSGVTEGALALPLVLMFAGLSVEAKLIPFGGWVRGVLKKANSLVGTLIISGYALAALLVVGRLVGYRIHDEPTGADRLHSCRRRDADLRGSLGFFQNKPAGNPAVFLRGAVGPGGAAVSLWADGTGGAGAGE